MELSENSRRPTIWAALSFALLAALLGTVAAGLLLGWHQIDSTNVAWLKGDAAVYQAGWEFLRRERWHFPPTWLDHLDFPFGISAAYLDVIPLIAIPLKMLSQLLPQDFQYLGVYALLCLVLQVYFALRLVAQFATDKVLIVLGALFFLNSPILLLRLFGHFSLCSQWLILAALWCYFRPSAGRIAGYLWPFAVLLVLSAGITPYLSVMVIGIAMAAVLRTRTSTGTRKAARLPNNSESGLNALRSRAGHVLSFCSESRLVWTGLFVVILMSSLVVFGFITPGAMPAIGAAGYGDFSMNVLGPLNPSGGSLLFKSFAVLPAQGYEGYDYLGAGVIGLGIVCLCREPSLLARLWSPTLRPLLIASLIFTLLAVSTRVTIGRTIVATIPVPRQIADLLAVFRSSGRFFWPVHDLLTLGALLGTLMTLRTRWAARATLAAALVVQFFDTLPIRQSVAREASRTTSTPLTANDWQKLAKSHDHLVLLPARQCDSVRTPGGDLAWPWFASLAAREGLTLNSVHAARSSVQSDDYNCIRLPRRVARGELDRRTAYVLGDDLVALAVARNRTHFCRRADGLNLCTFDPAEAYRSRELGKRLLPRKAAEEIAPQTVFP